VVLIVSNAAAAVFVALLVFIRRAKDLWCAGCHPSSTILICMIYLQQPYQLF
jgi:hypothetical protein